MATIDWDQFNENFQYYDKETIREVLEGFFEEVDDRISTLERNITETDFNNLAFNAHSLKSVIGNFMAPQTFELTRRLEMMGKEKNPTGMEAVFAELKESLTLLVGELKEYLNS